MDHIVHHPAEEGPAVTARVYDLAPRLAARRSAEPSPRARPGRVLGGAGRALDNARLAVFAARIAVAAWRTHRRRP